MILIGGGRKTHVQRQNCLAIRGQEKPALCGFQPGRGNFMIDDAELIEITCKSCRRLAGL